MMYMPAYAGITGSLSGYEGQNGEGEGFMAACAVWERRSLREDKARSPGQSAADWRGK